jgi:hypothetical protein
VNLAARRILQPGGVLISHDVYRQVRGLWMTPQPLPTVKGKSEPLQTYLVPRPRAPLGGAACGASKTHRGRKPSMNRCSCLQMAYQQRRRVGAAHRRGRWESRLLNDLIEWLDLPGVRMLWARFSAMPASPSPAAPNV